MVLTFQEGYAQNAGMGHGISVPGPCSCTMPQANFSSVLLNVHVHSLVPHPLPFIVEVIDTFENVGLRKVVTIRQTKMLSIPK